MSSTTLSASPAPMVSTEEAREKLRQILKSTAILYSTASHPIRHRNGAISPWAFYSWNATLTSEGLRLAALNLLERLRSFRSTQLVSYGYTATPLLSACILLGEGRYTGAVIREHRKKYLSCRRIEGPFDKSRPVVVIDDSLSSGRSLHNSIRAVEEEDGEVEGALALVHFPFRGGMEWANSSGYHTEALFNIWTDLAMASPEELSSEADSYSMVMGTHRFPDGLHPAELARKVAESYLRDGIVPLPPRTLHQSYEAGGGTFVSIRQKSDNLRLGRDGFWLFSPEAADPARDVVFATIDTLRSSAGRFNLGQLPDLKFAVTFLGPLERISPRQLDFERYGIVVRSLVLPNKKGGALPNTQVFISDIEQYRHARSTNAGVDVYEPHELFRHTLYKAVEPGQSWLPYGCAEQNVTDWWRDQQIGERLTSRARTLVDSAVASALFTGEPLNSSLIPSAVDGIAIKLYHLGSLVGYGLALGHDLNACLEEAVRQATNENRFAPHKANTPLLDITVAVLHHPESLGDVPLTYVAKKLRRGLDSLAVTNGGNTTVLLPSALTYNTWSRDQFVSAALAKAGLRGQPCFWTTYQTAEWVSSGLGVFPLRFGFPHRTPPHYDLARTESDIRLLATYIYNFIGTDGLPSYCLLPATNERQHAGTSARSLHGLLTLDSAGQFLNEPKWTEAAARGYRYCLSYVRDGTLDLPNRSGGSLADCVLLAGLARSHTDWVFSTSAAQLAARLAALFRPDGRISAVPKRLAFPDDQDYLPGAVLWAIGEYCRATHLAPPVTARHLEWYRQRFNAVPNWGMAGWQPQGWRAIYTLTHDPHQADLAFQAADWAVSQQLQKNGAFLEDLSPDEPSFDTGFIAEGIAAAWSIAHSCGDHARSAVYQQSWREAMQFMTSLIIYPQDIFGLRAGNLAVGGVRCMLSRSDIRIDQVSHCLSALIEGARLMRGNSDELIQPACHETLGILERTSGEAIALEVSSTCASKET